MKGIKQIKNYRLVKEISKGQIWTVYESIDDTTNQIYALKTFQRSKGSRIARDILKKEFRMLQSLNHENILKIIGYEKTVNNIYLILEYCNGGSLLDYLNFYIEKYKSPLPEAKVQFIIRQLINGLDFMNKNKILHRDLKPENILLHFQLKNILGLNYSDIYEKYTIFDSCIKISDLGYLKNEENYKSNSTICGYPYNTKDYLRIKCLNTKLDLYSLGKICYRLLTGIDIEFNNEDNQFLVLHNENCINRLEISIEAISFINGLLHNDINKRFDWNQIMNHPFVVNDTTTFKNIFLEKTSSISLKQANFANVWSMFYSYMINLNIDNIELVSIESKSKVQKHLNNKEKEEIQIKPNVILKDNTKSRNNSNCSVELEYENIKKIKDLEIRKSSDLLTEASNSKEHDKFYNKIEKEDRKIKGEKEEVESDKNTENDNKFSNDALTEYFNSSINLEERWEILFTESKCVEINNHANHYMLVQDYFN